MTNTTDTKTNTDNTTTTNTTEANTMNTNTNNTQIIKVTMFNRSCVFSTFDHEGERAMLFTYIDADGNDVHLMAQGCYIDGAFVFNITDMSDIKFVGFVETRDEIYRRGIYEKAHIYPSHTYQKDLEYNGEWSGAWGATFLKLNQGLFIPHAVVPTIYDITNMSTDLKTMVNPMTKQKFSVYPTIVKSTKLF